MTASGRRTQPESTMQAATAPSTRTLTVGGRHSREALNFQKSDVNEESALSTQTIALDVCEHLVDPTRIGQSRSLIFGMIQSGKTHALCQSLAVAADNGFRLFIVLTSDKNSLYNQTAKRLRNALPIVHFLNKEDLKSRTRDETVQRLIDSVKPEGRRALIFCSKNVRILHDALTVLKMAKAAKIPTVIFDDEADEASLNAHAWNKLKVGAGHDQIEDVSKIHGCIQAIRDYLETHSYVAVTATPQALFLQGHDAPFRPQHHVVLPHGQNYQGSEHFLIERPQDYNRPVDEAEVQDYTGIEPMLNPELPDGMKRAVAAFLVAAAMRHIDDKNANRDRGRYSMLMHISMSVQEHRKLRASIQRYILHLERKLPAGPTEEIQDAYEDVSSTVQRAERTAPAMPEVIEMIKDFGLSAQLLDVNASAAQTIDFTDPLSYTPCNIFVGGNVLARGMTIRGLITTYYGRAAPRPQIDTVLQHARWYGYRIDLGPYIRLFMPPSVWNRFRELHYHDDELRRAAESYLQSKTPMIPLLVPHKMQPTRRNVIEPGSLGAYAGGSHVPSRAPDVGKAVGNTAWIDEFLGSKFGARKPKSEGDRLVEIITLQEALNILERLPQSEWQRHGTWNDAAVAESLKQVCNRTEDKRVRLVWGAGMIRTRANADSQAPGHIVSWLGEHDQDRYHDSQTEQIPTLFLFKIKGNEVHSDDKGKVDGPGWGDGKWERTDDVPKKPKGSPDFYIPCVAFPRLIEGNGYAIYFRLDSGSA